MLIIHMPTNRCEPFYLIDKSRTNLLAMSAVHAMPLSHMCPWGRRAEREMSGSVRVAGRLG